MNYNMLLCCLLLLSGNALGQTIDYKIADYARPDLNRRFLNLNASLLLSDYEFFRTDSVNAYTRNFTRPYLFLNASNFHNSVKHQRQIRHTLSADADFFKRKDNGRTTERTFYSDLNYRHSLEQKTFGKKKGFFGIEYAVDFTNDVDMVFDTLAESFNKDRTRQLDLELALSVGKGRIEYINDAWHAKTMLEIFYENELLEKIPSAAEVQAFAEEVSRVKNIRNTDFRLEQIAEFEQLCEFLVSAKLINPENYHFFALLADAWEYESFTARSSGQEFEVGVRTIGNFENLKFHEADKQSYLYGAVIGTLDYNNYKVISDNWQFDFKNHFEIGPETQKNLLDETQNTISGFKALFSTEWALRYLPSQRTNLALSLHMIYDYHSNELLEGTIVTEFRPFFNRNDFREYGRFNTEIACYFSYYFSPRFTVFANAEVELFKDYLSLDRHAIRGWFSTGTSYRFY